MNVCSKNNLLKIVVLMNLKKLCKNHECPKAKECLTFHIHGLIKYTVADKCKHFKSNKKYYLQSVRVLKKF